MKVWKKALAAMIALLMTVGSFAATGITCFAQESKFRDVTEGAYYYDPVMWAVENKVTSGISKEMFGVGQPCTREQVVTLLWNYAGQPKAEEDQCTFEDVDPEHYYYEAMLWAIEQELILGYNAKTFGVGDPCTREQIVFILWKFEGMPDPIMKNCTFKDTDPLYYFYSAMCWAVSQGIVSGYDKDTFGVGDACTREQIVTFLYRAYAEVPELSIVGKWSSDFTYLDIFGEYFGPDIDPFMDYESVNMTQTFIFKEDGTYVFTVGIDDFMDSLSAMLENGFDKYVKFIVNEAALEGEYVTEEEVWEIIGLEKGNLLEDLGFGSLEDLPSSSSGQYFTVNGRLYTSEDVNTAPDTTKFENYVVNASTLLLTAAFENGKYLDSDLYPIYLTKVN